MTPDTEIDRRVLHRVRSLLAKAESTTFAEEAAALTAKAQELMAVHALDRALIDGRSGDSVVTSVRVVLHAPYAKDKYPLLSAVAWANRCRAILGTRDYDDEFREAIISGDRVSTVFGHRSDLDVVETLFTSLLLQAVNIMTAHGSVVGERGQNRTRSFRHSFLNGFAWTIGERLRESQDRVTTAVDEAADGGLLPVLADREAGVDAAVAAAFPHLGRLSTSISNGDGLAAGHRAGRRADIGLSRVTGSSGQLPRG